MKAFTYLFVFVCVCAHTGGSQERVISAVFYLSLPSPMRQGISMNLGLEFSH